jgi:hypothetical protein
MGTTQLALLMILNGVIAALVSALTALGVSYFRTRGQNLATKHDFDELSKQLKANTKLVETIKSEVSQRDWVQREWTNLRRVKLEALLEKMPECEAYLDQRREAALGGSVPWEGRDVISEFNTISDMYFAELWKETYDFSQECRKEAMALLKLAQAVLKAGDDSTAVQSAWAGFSEAHWPPKNRALARDALRDAARTLLERTMNVDERPR